MGRRPGRRGLPRFPSEEPEWPDDPAQHIVGLTIYQSSYEVLSVCVRASLGVTSADWVRYSGVAVGVIGALAVAPGTARVIWVGLMRLCWIPLHALDMLAKRIYEGWARTTLSFWADPPYTGWSAGPPYAEVLARGTTEERPAGWRATSSGSCRSPAGRDR